jgi:branched-chain amino acid transport system ATP-binding protein
MSHALRTITGEHRNLWRLTSFIAEMADEIERGTRPDPRLFGAVFDYLENYVNRMHHPKEDAHLFRLFRLRAPHLVAVIEELEADHSANPERLVALRRHLLAGTASDAAARAFAGELRETVAAIKNHMAKEERELLAVAESVLLAEDFAELDAAFADNDDPLFGEKAQAEFRELYHRIVNLAPESAGMGGQAAGRLVKGAAAPLAETVLAVRGLHSAYGRIEALRGIDIEIRQGELVALVGANGAGKTTLLRAISGVQPVSAGSVIFQGEDITKLRADQRVKRGICQVPEGRQVFGPLSIEDNLRLGAYTQPKEQAERDLERVWKTFPVLQEKRKLPAGTLSGGQQQMLAIGRALMGRPKLLLLDEPSMGLAPLLVEEVFNVITTLRAQGMTIFLVEQNAVGALAIADRGYVIETGCTTLTGSGQELLNNEQVRAAYLGI